MTTTQDATVAAGSGWRSLIYVPAQVSEDGSGTILKPATLQVLDQLLLPHTISYISIDTIQNGWDVIHHMNIRGAPLIAIVAILSLGIIDLQCHRTTQDELQQIEVMNSSGVGGNMGNMEDSFHAIQMYIHGKIDYLATSRPTAVNLFNALRDVKELIQSLRHPSDPDVAALTPKQRIITAIVKYAEQMLQNDEADCRAIGDYGAQEIVTKLQRSIETTSGSKNNNQITVMTICNTGSLATANYGTALGVIRSIHYKYEQLQQVVVLETRPYNQGSRLTAFECIQDALPNPILICDNMVTAFINNYKVKGEAEEKGETKNMVIVVGADRVVANGDTANKIGTYQLAVLASIHQIPFYVAAPTTTLDVQTKHGQEIHIEIRPSIELIQSSNAPKDIPVWNPA
jgi:S-methyl-5-thioribose-1-phosphate isomerase